MPELTQSEIKLLELLNDGLNRFEIAYIMHYTPKSVIDKKARLYRKIGVYETENPDYEACLFYARLVQY